MPRQRSTPRASSATPRKRTRTTKNKLVPSTRSRAVKTADPEQRVARSPEHQAAIRQLAILALAIVLGLLGLAVHVLWIAVVVLMSILFGLIAANVRGGRGVIPELVAEAKGVTEDLRGLSTNADG